MKKLIVITTFVLLGTLANLAQATLFTGCISPGGDLKNVAEGPEPSKPCGKNDTMTQWEEPEEEPVSICPCDFKLTAQWAGWNGPVCLQEVDTPFLTLTLHSDDDRLLPRVLVEGNAGTGEAECTWISDPGFKQFKDILSLDELDACYADLNELAITLGRLSGCEIQ